MENEFIECAMKQEGVIDTTWNYQYQNGLANSHVVYEVEKGTSFYAEFVPIWGPGIQSYANKKDYKINKSFFFKID